MEIPWFKKSLNLVKNDHTKGSLKNKIKTGQICENFPTEGGKKNVDEFPIFIW